MKRFFTLFVVLIVFNSWFNASVGQAQGGPDPTLAAAVRRHLELQPTASINWKTLKEFSDSSGTIKSLKGLELATNLEWLDIHNSPIHDLTPLANLKQLREIGIWDSEVNDITPLAGLIQLETLQLANSRSRSELSDIRPVAGLTQLVYLHLTGHEIRDIRPVAGLINLSGLTLGANQISDITPIAGLTQLESLALSINQISDSDITPLAGLTQLETLSLRHNQVSDIALLARLRKLKALHLGDNEIRDITPLAGLTQLAALDLHGNQINDITPLTGLKRLEGLDLGGNQIKDITPLTGLTKLRGLGLATNHINDLSPLARLRNLQALFLSCNQISNITPLTGLTKLEMLDLGENQITDAGRLETLPKLTTLRLEGNPMDHYILRPPIQAPNLFISFLITSQRVCPARDPKPEISPQETPPEETSSGETPPQSLVSTSINAADLPPIYWVDSESNTLYRLTDGEVQPLLPNVRNATGLAVDVAGGRLYWTERTSDRTGRIRRANLDGTNVRLVKNLTSVPHGIALDPVNGKLYVMNAWGKIQRLNVNGSNFQPNLITGLDTPSNLVVDVASGKVYWIETPGGSGRIRRANLDGSSIQNVATGLAAPLSLAVANGNVYWTSEGKLQRAHIDGTNSEVLETLPTTPTSIAVDTVRNALYLTLPSGGIHRRNLNGSGDQPIVTGLVSPSNIVLGIRATPPATTRTPEPSTTSVVDAAADVNQDQKVNKTDLLLVVRALGENPPANPNFDVNADGAVNIADVLLVIEALDDPVSAAAPSFGETVTSLDSAFLTAQIDLLRAESDGSLKYEHAIAFFESLLAAIRPTETRLLVNYPNPFNPETWIPYELATDTDVRITIYNAQGVVIRTLALGHQSAEYYTGRERAAYWDGRNAVGEQVASGVYFYQLETDTMSSMRKMVILK